LHQNYSLQKPDCNCSCNRCFPWYKEYQNSLQQLWIKSRILQFSAFIWFSNHKTPSSDMPPITFTRPLW